MKIVSASLVFLCLACSSTSTNTLIFEQQPEAEYYFQSRSPYESLAFRLFSEEETLGTAFLVIVNETYFFVTAAHVIAGINPRSVFIDLPSGFSAGVVNHTQPDPYTDLSIISIDNYHNIPEESILVLARANSGDNAACVNYSVYEGLLEVTDNQTVSCGNIAGIEDERIRIMVPAIERGASGAPIVSIPVSGERTYIYGMLTNRIVNNDNGTYSGQSFGIASGKIYEILSLYSPGI